MQLPSHSDLLYQHRHTLDQSKIFHILTVIPGKKGLNSTATHSGYGLIAIKLDI